jgi:hypothetical protein
VGCSGVGVLFFGFGVRQDFFRKLLAEKTTPQPQAKNGVFDVERHKVYFYVWGV